MSYELVSKEDLQKIKSYDSHEEVRHVFDPVSGLEGYIAIHNTNLGAAVGGTRMFPYENKEAALFDVLRLSRAMSYKCAMANVNAGGGKAVIIGDPKNKDDKLLKSYAEEIKNLNGRFYTGEDVGISESDVQYMLQFSPFFIGKSNLAGDPSPYASMSVYYAMKAAAKFVWGSDSLQDKNVAVKGVGKVGGALVDYLMKEQANVTITDIDQNRVDELQAKYPNIKVSSPEIIHTLEVDIYSPCAMGSEFTDKTKSEIKTKIICGGANNQLSSNEVGDWLSEHNVIYIPDYVANGGGLINVVDELEPGGYNKSRVISRIEHIKSLIEEILENSSNQKISTNRITDNMAETIFKKQLDKVSLS